MRIYVAHHHRTNLRAAFRQAVETTPKGRWPLAVCKDDREPAVVCMQLEDFLEMTTEWWEGRRR